MANLKSLFNSLNDITTNRTLLKTMARGGSSIPFADNTFDLMRDITKGSRYVPFAYDISGIDNPILKGMDAFQNFNPGVFKNIFK